MKVSPPTKNGSRTLKKADNGKEKIYTFRKTERTSENPGVMDKELEFLYCPAGVFETKCNDLIIKHFRQEVKSYDYEIIEILQNDRPVCPCCAVKMHIHSTYQRIFIFGKERIVLLIRRLRCVTCRAVHALLPDFVAPYRIHTTAVVQECSEYNATIDKSAVFADCSVQTIKRWRKRLKRVRDTVISVLQGLFRKSFSADEPFEGSSLHTAYSSFKVVTSAVCLWGGINILLASDNAKIWL